MSRDLRHYASQTSHRLILGFLVLVFVVGEGLIYLIFGRDAALMGLGCLLAAFVPVMLVWISLRFLQWIVDRANQP